MYPEESQWGPDVFHQDRLGAAACRGLGGERRRPLANMGLRFSPVEHEENATKLGKWVAFIVELVGDILDTETARIDVRASEKPITVGCLGRRAGQCPCVG